MQRTWACVLAAAVLYVPANMLPVMTTDLGAAARGAHADRRHPELWVDGSWGLAVIVFIASIAVPVLKIGVLGAARLDRRGTRRRWRRLERAKLYRLIEAVGHWSMLDVYVVVLLAATVRFGPLASVAGRAGPARVRRGRRADAARDLRLRPAADLARSRAGRRPAPRRHGGPHAGRRA